MNAARKRRPARRAGDSSVSLLHCEGEAATRVRSHISPGPYRSFRELSLFGPVGPSIWCPPTFVGNSGIECFNGVRGFALWNRMGEFVSKDTREQALKAAWKARQKQDFVASLPMPTATLRALFDYLDAALDGSGAVCDHTLRHTRAFLSTHGVEEARALPWLADHGGYCDCEVLHNVESDLDGVVKGWQRSRALSRES